MTDLYDLLLAKKLSGGGGGGGGGGGDAPFSFKLVHTEDLGLVQTTSSSASTVKQFWAPAPENTNQAYICVIEGDQETGFDKSMSYFAVNGTTALNAPLPLLKRKSDGTYALASSGVYLSGTGASSSSRRVLLTVSAKSDTSSGAVNGHYTLKLYAIGY